MPKAKWGFTLLELIVVIVIIAILATLGYPEYRKMKEKGEDSGAKSTLKLIIAAQKIYRMETGEYVNATNNAEINSTFRIDLPSTLPYNWEFQTKAYASPKACCANTTHVYDYRRRWMFNDTLDEPINGTACP